MSREYAVLWREAARTPHFVVCAGADQCRREDRG